MSFQLNPDAAEFIPVSPQILGPKLNLVEDFPISGSPLKQMPMDDIQVPSQSEFDEEVCQRPREMEAEKDCTNGDYLQRTDYKDFMADRQKGVGIPGSLDDSEISSTKAEFGDESASFITATEFHRTGISTVDESFSSSERDYDIAKDPMAMSFTPSDFEAAFDKGVDLNAVHDLSTVDLDDKNGTVEDAKNDSMEEENNDTMEGEGDVVDDSSEMQPELATLTSEPKQPESKPESEQPTVTASSFTCAFAPGIQEEIRAQAQAPDSPYASSLQEYDETEATFIEHSDEPKTTEPSDTLVEEHALIEPAEHQEVIKSEPSPLTENYSTEFESEKELVSVDNEQPLSTCSADIEETKPIDEPSEDAVLPTSESQKDLFVKEADTPLSVSPVPDTMECTASQLKDEALESSPMEDVHVSATPSAFTLQSDASDFMPTQRADGGLAPEPAFTAATTVSDLLSSPIEDQHEEQQVPMEVKIEDVSKPISTAEPVQQQEQTQENLLDFSMDQDVCTKGPVVPMGSEATPPPTPLEPSDKITHNLDELICPIQSSTMLEDTIVSMSEQPFERTETCELEARKEVPLIEAREPEVVAQAAPALNLSESMQEFTGLEKQLQPEEAAPVHNVIPEAEPQAIKEEAVEQKGLVEPAIKETNEVQEEKIVSQVTPQVISEDKQEPIELAVEATEKKIEEPTVAPVAVAAAAVATAATVAAVTAQSKTKAKPAAKTTKTTTATKTTPKSTPTSPSKTMTGTARTSMSSAKRQITTTTSAARPKDLDASKKTAVSSTATKTAASKPAAAPKTTSTAATKPATRTSTAAPRPKSATASAKPNLSASDKKPTANGDVKSLSKPAAAKPPSKPATSSSTARTSLVKTSTSAAARTSTGSTTSAKPRPTSAVTSTTKTTTRSSTTTSTTSSATGVARPKTAPATSTAAKPRVTTTAKSPMIDKQIKETANKQISLARTSTSTASKTTRTSVSSTSTSTTVKRTSTSAKTTNVTSSTAKRGTAVSKVTLKTASAIKSTSSSGKGKVVQNGVSESMEINNKIITTTNSKLEDDVPKKDLSPVIAPTDNQLIMSSD